MLLTRLKNVLAMAVALFVLGASSQAAVCELACGLQVHPAACHAAMEASGSAMAGMITEHAEMEHMAGMSHEHCSHSMAKPAMPGMVHSVSSLPDGVCNHEAVSALDVSKADKSGVSTLSFAAVQWHTVAVVPVDFTVPAGYRYADQRPPLVLGGIDPLVVSLRV
jgi:uncharacterized protein involved in copper resistance